MAEVSARYAGHNKAPKRPENEGQEDALEEALASIKRGSMRYDKAIGGAHPPWMNDMGIRIWSFERIMLARLIQSQTFETVMGVIIIGNLLLMVYETNIDATCFPEFTPETFDECPRRSDALPWLAITNEVLLYVYSIEVLLRMYVERFQYVYNKWNHIDLFTVLVGWITKALSAGGSVSFLRIFRVFRLLRAARVLIAIREFYLLMSGFISSLRAIFFGSLMLLTVIVVWAILVVQVVHPTNAHIEYDGCERCSRGFASVEAASLTLFQTIVAGDSWGQISIPVIEEDYLVAPILMSIVVTVGLGIMNLILAVIVERATEARENDVEQKLKLKDAQREKDMLALARMCQQIDDDGSGSLSLQEMLEGCDSIEEFRKMMFTMDLRREDVSTLFAVLDEDRSGEVSYLEFCQLLDSCSKRDPAMLQSVIKYSVMEVRNMLRDDVMAILHQHTQMLEEQTRLLRGKAAGGITSDGTNYHHKDAYDKFLASSMHGPGSQLSSNNIGVSSAEDKSNEGSAVDERVEQVNLSAQALLPYSKTVVRDAMDSLNNLCKSMRDGEEHLTQLVSEAEQYIQVLHNPDSTSAAPARSSLSSPALTEQALSFHNDGHPPIDKGVPSTASGDVSSFEHQAAQLRGSLEALGEIMKSRDQRIQQVTNSFQRYFVDQGPSLSAGTRPIVTAVRV
eukprot:TRINITY_DN12902_c0_g1_i1.p1 TRINITY_DN12902_c0_g1~~TRINITY_DN12902_c0_g1_i1.p1  ORF type:complete len:680 (-),score=103.34 TRINITY_DN12902_c0_g1_i1:130-2169(-)